MVYVIADLHGRADALFELLEGMELCRNDKVIVAGDVGLRYGGNRSIGLERAMASYPCDFIVMRGNHDARYEAVSMMEAGWCRTPDGMVCNCTTPNIKYISDAGGVFNVGGKSVLFVPGGYSVDGWYRKMHHLSFEDGEELTYAEMVRLYDTSDKVPYDYVISHVAPYEVLNQLSDLFIDGTDHKNISHFTEKMCSYFYQKHNYKRWVFGHYHADRIFDGGLVMTYNVPVILQ